VSPCVRQLTSIPHWRLYTLLAMVGLLSDAFMFTGRVYTSPVQSDFIAREFERYLIKVLLCEVLGHVGVFAGERII